MLFFYFIFIGFISNVHLSCDFNMGCQMPFIRNGNYNTVIDFPRHLIIFHCNKNYTLYGLKKNICECGRWLYPLPICQQKFHKIPECSAPYIPKGWVECLTVGCNKFYVGTEAAIRCERGYQLVGSSRLHCRWDNEPLWRKATWSSPVPKCVLIDSDLGEVEQEPSLNIFYTENSSIMVIIIILSVLACGLMLLISAMLMNRLVKRRRLMRFQRSDSSFINGRGAISVSNCANEPRESVTTVQNASSRERSRWNCFSRNGLPYQHMETQGSDNITPADQEGTEPETPEMYRHPICTDDTESLLNPPCYEEAIKCSQYSIVLPSHQCTALNSKGNKKSKRGVSKLSKQDKLKHVPIRPGNAAENQGNSSTQNGSSETTETIPNNIANDNSCYHSTVAPGSVDPDNVSRRSTRVHYSRVVNNISAESNNSFLSGSIETMAVSDGTSVTVHTFDSTGSNPSIGSMRPQTGSIGDPTTCANNRHHPVARFITNTGRFNDSDFPDIGTTQRYSPPPSYESSITNQILIKSDRSCRSNTGSPSAAVAAVFVDNMACRGDCHNEEDDDECAEDGGDIAQ